MMEEKLNRIECLLPINTSEAIIVHGTQKVSASLRNHVCMVSHNSILGPDWKAWTTSNSLYITIKLTFDTVQTAFDNTYSRTIIPVRYWTKSYRILHKYACLWLIYRYGRSRLHRSLTFHPSGLQKFKITNATHSADFFTSIEWSKYKTRVAKYYNPLHPSSRSGNLKATNKARAKPTTLCVGLLFHMDNVQESDSTF